ncbi:MAG: PAS domain-containing protein [Calditrichaeota bacterium]|nr:MAG: PAS domain-containing protein [Calditrichota bacterium]MBL1207472.1 PAS domain-containing protein [Calditrichota bacterium]NOG47304.1 PAS domain-containing protein [Calditrichota bacterium]
MSDYLNQKKESILRVNRIIDDLQSTQDVKEILDQYKFKYDKLLKQYEQLNQVFEFHKGVIQNISSGIMTIDPDGKVTFMNKSALNLIGYKSADILGEQIDMLFADKEEGLLILKQVLTLKKMFESKEANIVAADGSIIPIGFSTTILRKENSDEETGIIFIFRDIRDLINFRKQMERMDRLATLGELSAGIAHEIRNPLAGIKTSAQVLEESFSPGDFRSQLVSRIVKEIDRSNKLLQRFFHFAKPSRPKPDFHSLKNIIDGVYLLLAPRLMKRKIEFSSVYDENLPSIYIDESQFEQVILNLFLNAFDAMPNGGVLLVKAEYDPQSLVFENQEYPGIISILVSDSGNGISPEKLEKIFNPFYTSKSDGVGLGLSISSRLLEENQSKIEVESVPEKGATFKITLPFVKENLQE